MKRDLDIPVVLRLNAFEGTELVRLLVRPADRRPCDACYKKSGKYLYGWRRVEIPQRHVNYDGSTFCSKACRNIFYR